MPRDAGAKPQRVACLRDPDVRIDDNVCVGACSSTADPFCINLPSAPYLTTVSAATVNVWSSLATRISVGTPQSHLRIAGLCNPTSGSPNVVVSHITPPRIVLAT